MYGNTDAGFNCYWNHWNCNIYYGRIKGTGLLTPLFRDDILRNGGVWHGKTCMRKKQQWDISYYAKRDQSTRHF